MAGTAQHQAGGRGDGRSGMMNKDTSLHIAALQEMERALNARRRSQAAPQADSLKAVLGRTFIRIARRLKRFWKLGRRFLSYPAMLFDRRHPAIRRITFGALAVATLMLIGFGALWWRLASGPIMIDLMTPWLTTAIEQNLGGRYRVEVGGTQLERDGHGNTALRMQIGRAHV